MKRITSSLLALLLALSMLIGMVPAAYAAPADTIESIDSTETVDSSETEDVSDESEDVAAYAADTELTDYVVVKGIKGFESRKFASFADAYAAIKPEIEKLASSDALGQGGATSAEAFKNFFTNVDENGNATLTYEITGNVVYDETNCEYLLTMGRHSSHYNNGEWLHLIKFKFVGTTANRGATLTVNSDITLPYEWWGEKVTTSISFENLTITGSAPSGLYPYQSYFEGIDFEVNNCTLNGIKIYNCSNVGGKYTITNSTLDGTGAPVDAYAIHLQGNESAPLTIKIDNNQISGYDRGINIDQKTAVAEITGNEISIKDKGRSCIQLTWLAKTTVSGNELALTGGNAITLHEKLLDMTTTPEITVTRNTITGSGYLIYDDAAANGKAFTSENLNFTFDNTNTVDSTVDKKTGVKGGVEYDLSEIIDNKVNSSSTTGVAKIGDTAYETLDAAFEAANDNDEIIINAGTYEMSDLSKLSNRTVTVSAAAGATVVFDNAGAIGMGSASVTFKGITFDYMPDRNYTGLQHAGNMVYNNCVFNGMVFLYGTSETFNTCKFNQTEEGAYNVWTYTGENVSFNNCEFTCYGRCVYIYNEGGLGEKVQTVSFVNSTFEAKKTVSGKAAIEISTELMGRSEERR